MTEQERPSAETLPEMLAVPPSMAESAPGQVSRDWSTRALNWARHIQALIQTRRIPALRSWLFTGVELALIFAWTLMITSAYLDLDPMVVPIGGEYLSAIQSHHL